LRLSIVVPLYLPNPTPPLQAADLYLSLILSLDLLRFKLSPSLAGVQLLRWSYIKRFTQFLQQYVHHQVIVLQAKAFRLSAPVFTINDRTTSLKCKKPPKPEETRQLKRQNEEIKMSELCFRPLTLH